MLTFRKEIYKKGSHKITLFDPSLMPAEVSILENSEKVDGIGGVLWDGTLAACDLIRQIDMTQVNVLELGCGAGLFGVYASRRNTGAVVMTDREVDLVEENVVMAKSQSQSILNCECVRLDWGDIVPPEIATLSYDMIVGCEITCLYKQHSKLVQTIRAAATDNTIILMTFDGPPSPVSSTYERKFNELMRDAGFLATCAGHYRVDWFRDTSSEESPVKGTSQSPRVYVGTLTDFLNPGTTLSSPVQRSSPLENGGTSEGAGVSVTAVDSFEHHVLAYYRPCSTRTCSRCHSQFLPLLNGSSNCICRYHSGFYVCRYTN